jgi:methionyl aminopeptidase
MIKLKSEEDIKHLKISGRILSTILAELKEKVREGTGLSDLDAHARKRIKEEGAIPSFLGYKSRPDSKPYPAAICASLNDEVVHTPPDNRTLKNGDVIKIDLGVRYNDYITDSAITIGIGDVSEEAQKLINTTQHALEEAIKVCIPGNTTGDIGHVVETIVKKAGFGIIERLTGHGVGFALHEPPSVPNEGEKGSGVKLEPGLVIAIEPMVAIGSGQIIEKPNGAFATKDGSLTAHFEKTIAITKNGCEVLTK